MTKIGKVYGLTQSTWMITYEQHWSGSTLLLETIMFRRFLSVVSRVASKFWNCDEFINAFRLLGENWELNTELIVIVASESFVCYLYRYKDTDINKIRRKIFDKKFVKEEKVIDLSLLPPCQSTLYLHILRSNYVARIWKSSLLNTVKYPRIMENSWMENGEIVWVDDLFQTISWISWLTKILTKETWNSN